MQQNSQKLVLLNTFVIQEYQLMNLVRLEKRLYLQHSETEKNQRQ